MYNCVCVIFTLQQIYFMKVIMCLLYSKYIPRLQVPVNSTAKECEVSGSTFFTVYVTVVLNVHLNIHQAVFTLKLSLPVVRQNKGTKEQ